MNKNASTFPKRYFGLHMCPGVAQYADPGENNGEPYRILLSEDVCKDMDATYEGRLLYVRHVDESNPSDIASLDQSEKIAAGVVVRSFYNPCDGKHWAEFMVESDAGHEALSSGWKLSNAYVIKQTKGGGEWHNVDYKYEVVKAEYDHLAIVPNPRYQESVVLTPEQFKEYNQQKEAELKKLTNSKDEESTVNFFKRTKVDNAKELEETMVTLKSGKSISIASLVKNAEEAEEKEEKETKEPPMANGEHMVKIGDEKMSVNALIEKHMNLVEEHEELKKKDDDAEPYEGKETPAKEKAEEAKKKSDDDAKKKSDDDAKKKSDDEAKKDKKNNDKFFNDLKNAERNAGEPIVIETSSDRVARGKARYGSK